MIERRHSVRCLVALLGAGASLIVPACGSDDLGRRYSVSGTVTYKDEPVEKGVISFLPEDPGKGRAGSGIIESGSYSLTTHTPGDGAFPGKYKVVITSKNVDLSKAQAKVKSLGPGVALPQDYVAKAYRKAKSNIPARYSIPSTSPLTAEVKEQPNRINFGLTD